MGHGKWKRITLEQKGSTPLNIVYMGCLKKNYAVKLPAAITKKQLQKPLVVCFGETRTKRSTMVVT
jgi:hypothetical protein